MPRPLIEIICCSAEDCASAEKGGADRVELVSAIEMGGLTPSSGTLKSAVLSSKLPMMAMIRPRSGGFCYTSGEFDSMERDA
ncbi:MAG TPA: copper homeostasis protein CutC, partial [Fimbriimonadaceae bacterium]|nr:copper homeostasis protein CutC [Fimbriimonadaceae bacterium]